MSEIHRLLKIEEDITSSIPALPTVAANPPQQQEQPAESGSVPLNLPALDELNLTFQQTAENEEIMPKRKSPGSPIAEVQSKQKMSWESAAAEPRKRLRGVVIYPVIFVIAFVAFYALLNLPSLASQVKAWFIKPQDEQILQEDLADYNQWISGYFFSVKNRDLLGANNDIDHDGLTNYEEYVLGTNPTLADSSGTGVSDGVKVIDGLNYWGTGPMTNTQRDRVKKLDLNLISNRISYNSAINHNAAPAEHAITFDQNREGQVSIPRLNLQVPLIWSQDPASFETDLARGVIHYPGTALPGEQGTMYVSGHSSDYIWKRNDYKRVFAQINALQPGDDIFVNAYGTDGKLYNFRYQVAAKNVYKPDDQTQFIDNTGAKLNLSTCWPIGTAKDRYVVTAVLKPL